METNPKKKLSFKAGLVAITQNPPTTINLKDIDDMANSRNILVHEGKFFTTDPSSELIFIFEFADRLILTLLGYQGQYTGY